MAKAQLDVNLFDPAVIADPYPIYESIREAGRVVWNDLLGGWMVPGYEDCVDVLTKSGDRYVQMNTAELTPWFEGPNMISVDGPEHVRLRRSLSPYFTRQPIAEWEGRVAEVVDDLLVPLVKKGRFDIVSDFTLIPTVIVAEMMGVPPERYEDFRRWSHVIAGNVSYGHEDPAIASLMQSTGREANDYLAEEVTRHRRESFEDLITAMLEMSMSEEEIRSTGLLLVLAGYDTTAKFLANSLVTLEQHPDMRAAVVEDMSLLPGAIEEILRWSGVTHVILRNVLRDTVLADTELRAGDTVYVMKAAANRDPQHWDDPLRFDVRREPKSHLGFGFGAHLCLGAPLARLEAKVALERLLTLAPDYSVHDVDYGTGMIVRGPEAGFVQVGASR